MILRDDHDDVWTDEADATLDRRVYYCQNWRADVVAILAANGRLIERAWYEPYGTPHGSTNGDFTGSATGTDDHYLVPNGIVDIDDQYTYLDLSTAPDDLADMTGSSDPGHADYGRPDGTIDASDFFFWLDCHDDADDLGRNVLSEGHTGAILGTFSVRNRKGLAGYEWDPAIRKYHVRNRVLDPDTGRWTRTDPLVDASSLWRSQRFAIATLIHLHGMDASMGWLQIGHHPKLDGTGLLGTDVGTCGVVTAPGDPDVSDSGVADVGGGGVVEHLTDGPNAYQYSRAGPIKYTDLSGLGCMINFNCNFVSSTGSLIGCLTCYYECTESGDPSNRPNNTMACPGAGDDFTCDDVGPRRVVVQKRVECVE